MAGLVPRLSGSSWARAELELVRVERRGRRRFSEPGRVFSVHEIGAHESNEFEQAVWFFDDLLQGAQKKVGDQRDEPGPPGRLAALISLTFTAW